MERQGELDLRLDELAAAAVDLMASQPAMPDDGSLRRLGQIVRDAHELGRNEPLTGADFTDGAWDGEEDCGCGEPITFFEGEWMHIVSEELRGTGDHVAEPAAGYYVPDGMGEEE